MHLTVPEATLFLKAGAGTTVIGCLISHQPTRLCLCWFLAAEAQRSRQPIQSPLLLCCLRRSLVRSIELRGDMFLPCR